MLALYVLDLVRCRTWRYRAYRRRDQPLSDSNTLVPKEAASVTKTLSPTCKSIRAVFVLFIDCDSFTWKRKRFPNHIFCRFGKSILCTYELYLFFCQKNFFLKSLSFLNTNYRYRPCILQCIIIINKIPLTGQRIAVIFIDKKRIIDVWPFFNSITRCSWSKDYTKSFFFFFFLNKFGDNHGTVNCSGTETKSLSYIGFSVSNVLKVWFFF